MSSNTQEALVERIKELTCLYEISSIINNADPEAMSDTLRAMALSLKKAFQHPNQTEICIETPLDSYKTGANSATQITSEIIVFNKTKGLITASLNELHHTFLKEEKPLLDNVALKLGNLLERIEIQKNETSLRRQMERADRLGILGEITAGIAHELNTPLANILGFTELLKEDLKENTQSLNDLDKIIQNAIFSREVVKKLMFFACEMPQEMQYVNIVPNIKNAIALLDASFKKANVKYKVNIKEESLILRADNIQLTQIVFNLIINAIYFSPENGSVTIEAYQTANHVVLKISDEGSGLTEEALDKIFQPFFTTKPTGEGLGLGLSVVHGIVASHNGTITAGNNLKKGATFTVKIPKS